MFEYKQTFRAFYGTLNQVLKSFEKRETFSLKLEHELRNVQIEKDYLAEKKKIIKDLF